MESNRHSRRSKTFLKVWEPGTDIPGHRTPSSARLHLQFYRRKIYRFIQLSDDGSASLLGEVERPTAVHAQCIDPRSFMCHNSYEILSAMLSALHFSPQIHERIIRQMVPYIRWIIENRVQDTGPKIVPLFVEIKTVTDHLPGEEELIRMAEMQSAAEAERSRYGMVPASGGSIKALENVTMQSEGESCMVCLEELPYGSQATRMPCSHLFHGDCITRWLENSHYCPICRFEMPT